MDREFTGWVAPIANRFSDGQVLYANGGRSPLAPLPFVLDVERLKRSLPKVIVIGPRDFWKRLHSWNPGAQRFTTRVQHEILPAR
jgi:hypothetical protein